MSLLFEKIVPGATTCILIGGLRGASKVDFRPYRSFLWWVDSANTHPAPPGVARERIQIARIETATPTEMTATLEAFIRRDPRRLPSVFITPELSALQANAYDQVIAETYRQLESTHRARVTRQMDGFLWQKHILGNVAAYSRQRLPQSWAGALQGIPALVCGAGPSLDVSGPKLAAAAGNAIVFSADSALRALARHGVQADFAVSIDAAKIPEKCLPDGCRPARVVLSSVSPPSWQTAVPRETVFYLSGNQLTDDWLATQGIARTTIAAIESCGSTAIELATHLGCDPIYLFGLDLAVDPANQARRHQQDADPALYTKSNYDPAANLPRVPGNYVESVPCFAFGDWHALDERLANRSHPRIVNVNDRGARLRGTTLVHPEQFTGVAPQSDKASRLAALPSGIEPSTQAATTVLSRLRAIGDRCAVKIPVMRRALPRDLAQVAELFRSALVDPDCGRALGAFSLKVMPHLFPPIEGSPESWESLVDEFAELAQLARSAVTQEPSVVVPRLPGLRAS